MRRYVVDTIVPIVANGNADSAKVTPSINCRMAAIQFLQKMLESGKILVDHEGEIQAEYRKHLNPRGQPGVGDRFYQEVLHSAPRLIERIELRRGADGEYIDLPQAVADANFDPSDRKFAALAARTKAMVANATDSDWLIHRKVLEDNGIRVRFLCGYDKEKWFS
jgi:hypothetical protein